jgi:hypothetical protein
VDDSYGVQCYCCVFTIIPAGISILFRVVDTSIYPSDRPSIRPSPKRDKNENDDKYVKQAKMGLAVINALRRWRILVEAVLIDERDRCKKRTRITQLKMLSFLQFSIDELPFGRIFVCHSYDDSKRKNS